jgi:hypothetical protein
VPALPVWVNSAILPAGISARDTARNKSDRARKLA